MYSVCKHARALFFPLLWEFVLVFCPYVQLIPVILKFVPFGSGAPLTGGFPGGSVVKNLPTVQETWVQSLGQGDPLEEGMVTHSSIFAWEISRTGKHGRLYSPLDHRQLDTTKATEHACTHSLKEQQQRTSPLLFLLSLDTWRAPAAPLFFPFFSQRIIIASSFGCSSLQLDF